MMIPESIGAINQQNQLNKDEPSRKETARFTIRNERFIWHIKRRYQQSNVNDELWTPKPILRLSVEFAIGARTLYGTLHGYHRSFVRET
jgi:hypothetical protein